jgi:hypothetical protein
MIKTAIYISDDFSDFDRGKRKSDFWFDTGRKALYDYAKGFNIPVINTNKTSRFFKILDGLCKDNDKARFNTSYALKMMRWYEFIESEYDYAFFCDLDFIVTNPNVDVRNLIQEDTLYINSYRGTPSPKAARYKLIKHYNPLLADDKIINTSTGFHCIGKQSAIDVIKTFDRLGCNPMTQEGIDNMCSVKFPRCLDETMMAIAMNSMKIKYELANIAKLCGEREFYYKYETPVFYHVCGQDRRWTKDAVYKRLDQFFKHFTREDNV